MMKPNPTPKFLTYCIFFLTLLSWASAYLGIKIGIKDFTPAELALFRYLVGTFVMLIIYACFRNKEIPKIKDIPLLSFLGLMGFTVYNLALNYGETHIDAGTTSFITSQTPVLLTLFGLFMLGEELSYASFSGLALSFIGISIISLGQANGMHFNASLASLILATFSMAIYSIKQKKLLQIYHPITITTFAMLFGTLFMMYDLPALLREIPYASISSLSSAIYLGIFPAALGYLGWANVMNQISAVEAAAGLYFLPIITSILSWLILKEQPPVMVWIGGIIALSGAILITYGMNKRRQEKKISQEE